MPVDLQNATTFAVQIIKEAAVFLKEALGTSFLIRSKETLHDIVTEYDQKVENFLKDKILKMFPDHAIIAEESENQWDPLTPCWVIDPIDGTVNFSKGIPFFSISIALVIDQKVQVGVVYHVMQDEMFVAQKGHGAYLNGKSLHVSKTNTIKRAILATGFPYNLIENPNHCIEHFIEILKLGVPIRRMGSAAIDLCYIAAGRFDGFWEISLRPWDFAAAWLIVEEAKGKVTDMDGNPLNPFKTSSVLAANLDIHPSLIEHLKLRN
jgi:myo-inositol-1(or 4)-monophosphatase